MWQGSWIAAGMLVACATCPVSSGAAESAAREGATHDLTCDEQVRGVRPVLSGQWREEYVWKCLLEHQFEAFLRERRACSSASDCVEVQTFCPFGDGVSVARAYSHDVELEHRELFEQYSKRASCKYRSEPHGAATCTAGQCAFLPWSAPATTDRSVPVQ
jgi:hypothetical protein